MSGLLVACISDAASLIGVPTEMAKHFLQRRQKELQEIILQEVRDGDFLRVNQDDILSIVYRLLNDINEGVGKNNIRLLARLILGMNNKEQLSSSRFHHFNTILSELSYEQIQFLAEIVKAYKDPMTSIAISKQHRELFGIIKLAPADVFAVKKAVSKTKGSAVLLSLLGTGFFETFNPDIYPYKLSVLFKEFMDLVGNWDDVAKWERD